MTSHTLIAYTRMFLNVSKQESRIHYKVIKRAQVIQLTKCHLRVDAFKARIFILEIQWISPSFQILIQLQNNDLLVRSISIFEHSSNESCLVIVFQRACQVIRNLILISGIMKYVPYNMGHMICRISISKLWRNYHYKHYVQSSSMFRWIVFNFFGYRKVDEMKRNYLGSGSVVTVLQWE